MVNPIQSLSTRWIAIAAIVFFAPVMVTFAVAPGAWWANYPGILFHLAMFLLVSRLDAPEWARAAGYGWLVLDVMTGMLTLNGVPHSIADPVRFGGHIFAGIWIVTASLSGSRSVKIIGILSGFWLGAFSFVSPFFPMAALGPASILLVVWLAIIAWQNGSNRIDEVMAEA